MNIPTIDERMGEEMYSKEDLEIFGLNESFSREELEREYSLLLKRAKIDKDYDISQAEAAYSRILGLKEPKKISIEEQKKRDKKQKFSENLIFYIAGLIVLIILALTVPKAIIRKAVDLHICIAGEFNVTDRELLKQNLRPDVKSRKTTIEVVYASFDNSDEISGYSTQVLSFTLLGTSHDLMICDRQVLHFLTKDPADIMVLDMTEYLERLGISEKDERLVKSGYSVYAIKVESSSILDDIILSDSPYYIAMPLRADDIDNAIDSMNLILYGTEGMK